MPNLSVSPTNVSMETQYQGLLERVMLCVLCTLPSCVFLFVNGTMLFTLRSKAVFCDTCRYILLYNLLFADTCHLAKSQILFLMAICRVSTSYPLCATLLLITNLTTVISPLTLVVMSLERYVAVCYPLRHASIITIRNTAVAVTACWTVSLLNNLARVILFLQFPSEKMPVKELCSVIAVQLGSLSLIYDIIFTCVVFVSAGLAIIFSYIAVLVTAKSASTDKASAQKARHTLLLHLGQLGLSLASTIYNPLITLLYRTLTRIVFVWVQDVFYVTFIILPRCLSSLIYGLRDQTIRPVLIYHLCCRHNLKVKAVSG